MAATTNRQSRGSARRTGGGRETHGQGLGRGERQRLGRVSRSEGQTTEGRRREDGGRERDRRGWVWASIWRMGGHVKATGGGLEGLIAFGYGMPLSPRPRRNRTPGPGTRASASGDLPRPTAGCRDRQMVVGYHSEKDKTKAKAKTSTRTELEIRLAWRPSITTGRLHPSPASILHPQFANSSAVLLLSSILKGRACKHSTLDRTSKVMELSTDQ